MSKAEAFEEETPHIFVIYGASVSFCFFNILNLLIKSINDFLYNVRPIGHGRDRDRVS